MTIVLASQSPRRRSMLSMHISDLKCLASEIDEKITQDENPVAEALRLAFEKAKKVSTAIKADLIIGADTMVLLENQILDKPGSAAKAKSVLQQLSGTRHEVVTAVSMLKGNGDHLSFFESTEVTFSKISESLLNEYVASGSPLDKAGAYGIQDALAARFVKKIEGDYNNVVGFPIFRFFQELEDFAPNIFDYLST